MIKVCINSSNCLLPIKHQGITETYGEPVHWCIKASCAHVRYNGYQYQRNNGRHDAGANEVIKMIKLSHFRSWWHHQMEIFPTLLALCGENSLVTGEFHSQRPVTLSFDAFFYLPLNKRLNKQLRHQWFETPPCSVWHHCNVHSFFPLYFLIEIKLLKVELQG